MAVMGIDVGTGGTRAVVVDENGGVIASGSAEHQPFRTPEPGWAEQDPRDWWRAAVEAVRNAMHSSQLAAGEIKCVGFSGQMHGAVMLDGNYEIVRPALIWCDQRTGRQCRELAELFGLQHLIQLTCNPPLSNFTLTKLLWVRENEPKSWQRVAHVLLPKDYVRFQLTGQLATDVADASGMLLLDVAQRSWSDEVLLKTAIERRLLPELFESQQVCGAIGREASRLTGLPVGTPVVAGAGDQASGAVGMGITRAGVVSATIGTSGVVFAATDRPALDPKGRLHTFCHAIPKRWHVMGVTQAAGLSLRWFRDLLRGSSNGPGASYDQLTQEAAGVRAAAEGVFWAPYLMGERTPHLDPNARAAFIGLTASHGRPHLGRAVLEGVAFSLKDTFNIFNEIEVPVAHIRLGGGGARSPLWQQIQADAYGHEVELVEADEGAAFGAAILAGVGINVWDSVDQACDAVVRVSSRVRPDSENCRAMQSAYKTYQRIYPALRSISEPGSLLA
jgi:xylulokinase